MWTTEFPEETARHQLLEGVLLRLAPRDSAGAFVLRGGLLMRHWFRPAPRPADDIDLVAAPGADLEETVRCFLPVLSDESADGVTFDPGRTRVTGIRLGTGTPGARVFATGSVGAHELDFNVDITLGPPPRPAPVLTELPTACGAVARVWACRPEAVTGQKVQALLYRGALAWRPKDLNDLRVLLARVSMSGPDVRTAIAAYLSDLGGTPSDARALFGPGAWWDSKLAGARWWDFARGAGPDTPRDLAAVVAEVAQRLVPVLEDVR